MRDAAAAAAAAAARGVGYARRLSLMHPLQVQPTLQELFILISTAFVVKPESVSVIAHAKHLNATSLFRSHGHEGHTG
jgi:hypothetical protein